VRETCDVAVTPLGDTVVEGNEERDTVGDKVRVPKLADSVLTVTVGGERETVSVTLTDFVFVLDNVR
jgi:hypothetical protein